MSKVATISSTWTKRMLLLGTFMTGFAAWFFYDGLVEYPKQNKRVRAYKQLTEEGRKAEWPQYASDHNWPDKNPGEIHGETAQLVMGSIALTCGLAFYGWYLACRTKRMTCEDGVIVAPWGQRVPFDSIRQIDKRKWDSKGIAIALYEKDRRRTKLIIDDYKYAGAEDILRELEEYLEPKRQD